MPVARDHLGRNRFNFETHFFGDMCFDKWINMRKCPDSARNGTGCHFTAGRNKPLATAAEFSVKAGKFQPKRCRFSMNAMAAANGGGALMLLRPFLQTGKQTVEPGQHQITGAAQLHR